jgi:outer membrane receptor protein involved in Fe transport
VDYDVDPDTSAFVMLNYGILDSDDPSQHAPIPQEFVINSGNPFLPSPIQAYMTAHNVPSITVDKSDLDGAGDIADDQTTFFQVMAGVKGKMFGDWNWNVQGNSGVSVFQQGYNNIGSNANADAAAYVVTGANGQPVCGPLASNPTINAQAAVTKAQLLSQVSPGCVPYNIFGTAARNSPAQQYILNPTLADGTFGGKDRFIAHIRQTTVMADVSGTPFALPAGDLNFAAGANYRTNSYDQAVTANDLNSNYATLNARPVSISQSVWEVYTEIGAPVVRNLPFAEAVNLSGAVRYTDYSISGGVTTWKFGGTWDINDEWRVRATRSQDIEAPNFSQLAPVTVSGGATLNNPVSGVSARIPTSNTVGNPSLKPEVSQNYTYGIVFSSDYDWLPGFQASWDYYRLKISGVIASVGAQQIINLCLLNQNQTYCNMIQFTGSNTNTTFGIQAINSQPLNLSSEIQDGHDFNISEHLDLDQFGLPGSVDFSTLAAYINQQRVIQTLGGTTTNLNNAGMSGSPRWSVTPRLTYTLDRLATTLRMRYYSPIKYSNLVVGPDSPAYNPASSTSINRNIWPGATTFDLQVAYDVLKQSEDNQNLQVYFNMNNVFDKDPPLIWQYVSEYDVMGRYFELGLRYDTN